MIEVELFHAPPDGTTKFYALSYVWGDAAKTRDVFVDGERFPATLNLWNALHHILARPGTTLFGGEESVCRSPHKEGSSATEEGSGETWLAVTTSLWIDAICINQSSLTERSEQVPRMDDIYSKASKVIVWPQISMPHEREYKEDIITAEWIATLAQMRWTKRRMAGYLNSAEDGPDKTLVEALPIERPGTISILIHANKLFMSVWAHSRRLWTT
ncbi:hypothetical protein RB598_000588 [Gaeumannomyces tritici]